MIKKAINFITTAIQNAPNFSSEKLMRGNIAFARDGSEEGERMKKKLILSLVNIEEDRVARNPLPYRVENEVTYNQNPALHLNLYLLFTANYDQYEDAMAALSALVGFFQKQNHFTRENAPGLDPGIEKLIFDLYNMNLEQVHHLWSMLGGKYLPSILYKMRMVTIQHLGEDEASLVRKVKTIKNML